MSIVSSSRFAWVVTGALTLSACGGGSSNDGGTTTPPPPPNSTNYSIGGTLTGLPDKTTVVVQLNGSTPLSRTQNGTYVFPVGLTSGATYSVTVATPPAGMTCTVSGGSGTIGSANISNANVHCSPPVGKFVYVPNRDQGGAGYTVSGYSINASTGALTAVTGSPFTSPPGPVELTADPAGKALYATIKSTSTTPTKLAAFSINATSGALTHNPVSPFDLGSPLPPINDAATYYKPLIHRSNQFIYVGVETGKEYGLAVQSNGSLADIQGPSTVGDNVRPAIIDPTGNFLYAPNSTAAPDRNGQVTLYGINQTTGNLVPVGSYATGMKGVNQSTLMPSGKFMLLPHSSGGCGSSCPPAVTGIVVMSVDAVSGALTPVAGSPFALPVGLIVAHPTKNLVYVFGTNTIAVYQIDATSGALTAVAGSPFSVRNSGGTLVTGTPIGIEPSGRFLYMALEQGIDAYSIDQTTGAIAPIANMPVQTAGSHANVTMDPSGRYFYVSQSGSGLNIETIATFAADPLTGVVKEVNRVGTGLNPGMPEVAGRQ